MTTKVELVCAKCHKPGGLSEIVELESTGYRSLSVSIVDGKREIERGRVESNHYDEEVRDTGSIHCSHCNTEFDSIDDATGQVTREYRCGECGWWGLQDWLHPIESEGCEGELAQEEIGSTTHFQKLAEAA